MINQPFRLINKVKKNPILINPGTYAFEGVNFIALYSTIKK